MSTPWRAWKHLAIKGWPVRGHVTADAPTYMAALDACRRFGDGIYCIEECTGSDRFEARVTNNGGSWRAIRF
jgi:hypothetical protein